MSPGLAPDQTFRGFLRDFVRVPDGHGQLRPLELFPAAEAVVAAVDARGPDGERPYREVALSWPKKSGKSTLSAALALYALVADPFAPADREVFVIASDLAQSTNVVVAAVARMIARNSWLRDRCRVGATEIAFRETTAGRFRSSHVLRALPRDKRSNEGLNPSCVIFDETWTHDSWEGLEGLSPSPARRCPLTVYASFAPLRSQGKGCPWVDVLQRARSGEDGSIFLSELSGPHASESIPWHSARWLAQMKALYSSCESRYQRLIWNVVAEAESAFLSTEEIIAALDDGQPEAAHGEPGVRYYGGVDLGLTADLSAFVVGHVDPRGVFHVDVLRQWRGTKARPVSLMEVEAEVIAVHHRFRLSGLHVDQWQSRQLQEQLSHRGIPGVRSVTIEPSWLDKAVTVTKSAFARRMIRLPARERELREQLESLQVREIRRDRLRFDSGHGPTAAGRHDDAAIALALVLMQAQPSVGVRQLPAHGCGHRVTSCCLRGGNGLPLGGPVCQACKGWQFVKPEWERSGQDLRTFVRSCRPSVPEQVRRANAFFQKIL